MVVAVVLGVPVAAQAAEAELNTGVNIIRESVSDTTYNIGEGQAVMISGQSSGEKITFKNCVFNLSGKTVKISGNMDGIKYNNGEMATKLFVSQNVEFENCTFRTAEGAAKSTSAGWDAAIYFYSGNINLKGCELTAEGYNGQFLGLYGSEGAVTFDDCDISTVGNKNGWSYAMYARSVLKLINGSTMTAKGSTTDSGNINCFYAGDKGTGYDAIVVDSSTIDFSDNAAGGFALNNVNIRVKNSSITVNDNKGNACNSGMWYLSDNSVLTMRGNRGGHALSCIGIVAKDSTIDIQHNGYAGLFLQSTDSSFTKCTVDIACNGEKLLSYSAGDVWLEGHTLTVADCTSVTQPGSAWLGGVGRKGAVKTAEGSSVVAYDLNSNAADNLKSNTQPVLTDANIALNSEGDKHTLFLNPFMKSDYARGNAEGTASNNDADLFKDDNVEDDPDIIGGDNAKIGQLTDAQLSHHRYDWSSGQPVSSADASNYGVMKYACVQACDDYAGATTEHLNSFDCPGTYVYAPLVGVSFNGNAGEDEVANLPDEQNNLAYGSIIDGSTPTRISDDPDVTWVFTGWYTDAACTEKFNFDEGLTDNWTVLYAGWKQSSVNVDKYADPECPEQLEEDRRTDVTLQIGAGESIDQAAVLFVMDKSTSVDVRSAAKTFVEELSQKDGADIKVAVINFSQDAASSGWKDFPSLSDEEKTELFAKPQADGTNYHAGLLKAMELLKSSEIEGRPAYLITISDGITYIWNDDLDGDGDTEKTTAWSNLSDPHSAGSKTQNGSSTWEFKYKNDQGIQGFGYRYEDGIAGFLDSADASYAAMKNDGLLYPFVYGQDPSEEDRIAIFEGASAVSATGKTLGYALHPWSTGKEITGPSDANSAYLLSTEAAVYKTAEAFGQLADMMAAQGDSDHIYALSLPEDGNQWTSNPYGKELMEYLAAGTPSELDNAPISNSTAENVFSDISDEIQYEIKSGTVKDIIFEGEYEGDVYDFDLTDSLGETGVTGSTFTLTVGDEQIEGVLDSEAAESGETLVNFGEKDGETGKYPYTVEYRIEGDDEVFYWTINVPVETGKQLKLTYNLTLVKGSEEPGTHSAPTNTNAVLNYKGTDGSEGTETFPVPVVCYEVRALNATIQPADMTIYMGGNEGYEGVVEDDSDEPIGSTNNSLPEPGFYITLPDEVNTALREAGIAPVGEGADLSKILSIHTKDDSKSWKLVKYGDTHSGAYDKYVYRIEPTVEEQDPVRLQFTDDAGKKYTSDAFDPTTTGALYETYSMDIYRGAVEDSDVVIDVAVSGKTYTCSMSTLPGELTIRYVVDNPNSTTTNNPVTGVVNSINSDSAENRGKDAYAVIDSSADYYINESSIDTTSDAIPSLLFDSIVGSETEEQEGTYDGLLADNAEDKIAENDPYFDMQGHESKYLDLVDAANGNAWLTTNSPVTVYWPYPEHTDKSTEFHLVHFQGLDRDMANESIVSEISQTEPDYIEVENTDYGVKFTLHPESYQIDEGGTTVNRVRFSPFVLAWGTSSTPPVVDYYGDLTIAKTVTGDLSSPDDEFIFTVTVEGAGTRAYGSTQFTDDVAMVTLKGGQRLTITNLPKGAAYTVEETDANGYELVSSKNASGTIPASSVTASFTNDKSTADTPEPATARFVARKVLNGAELKAGQFTFELRDADGRVVATATNDASGTIVFDGLAFDEAGTYEFTISEVDGGSEDYAYDASVKGCYVVVTEEGGRLVAEAFAHDDLVFTNEYVGTEEPGEPDEPDTPDTPDEPGEPTTPVTPGEDVPDTGDHTNGALPAVLALGGVALVGGALVVARRRAM